MSRCLRFTLYTLDSAAAAVLLPMAAVEAALQHFELFLDCTLNTVFGIAM